jgi:hypothetical protein
MPPIGPDNAALHPGQVGHASPLLFIGLIDDAAMFPPGNAPLDRALAEHLEHRSAWYADLVGPLLVPADRMADVVEVVATQPLPSRLRVGVIAPLGPDAAADALRSAGTTAAVQVSGVELPLKAAVDVSADWARLGADARAVWWEVDRGQDVRAQLDRLATADGGLGGAKLRTGGTSPAAVPSAAEVAAFLRHAIDVDLAFKLTAGLHHAVRATDPATGLEQHGVLNVLCAIKAALNGAEEVELEGVLAEADPATLVERTNGMSEADASVARAFWSSFGCCGVTDPIDDLVALGLLSRSASVRS